MFFLQFYAMQLKSVSNGAQIVRAITTNICVLVFRTMGAIACLGKFLSHHRIACLSSTPVCCPSTLDFTDACTVSRRRSWSMSDKFHHRIGEVVFVDRCQHRWRRSYFCVAVVVVSVIDDLDNIISCLTHKKKKSKTSTSTYVPL